MVVAGPNGAGKTTLTHEEFILHEEIVNADEIARALSSASVVEAGRLAILERRRCLEAGKSFVFETTLSGRREFHLVQEARRRGFRVVLHYVGLESTELCQMRVLERVARGGHDVPAGDLVRRYARSMNNLPLAIQHADDAFVYDNSTQSGFTIVAEFSGGRLVGLATDIPAWARQSLAPLMTS